MGFVNERTEDGQWQTIDRERDCILTKISGPNEDTKYAFELFLNKQLIKFSSFYNEKIHGKPNLGELRLYDITWDVFSLHISDGAQANKKEIFQFIEEALKARGWNYQYTRVSSITVKFDSNL